MKSMIPSVSQLHSKPSDTDIISSFLHNIRIPLHFKPANTDIISRILHNVCIRHHSKLSNADKISRILHNIRIYDIFKLTKYITQKSPGNKPGLGHKTHIYY